LLELVDQRIKLRTLVHTSQAGTSYLHDISLLTSQTKSPIHLGKAREKKCDVAEELILD